MITKAQACVVCADRTSSSKLDQIPYRAGIKSRVKGGVESRELKIMEARDSRIGRLNDIVQVTNFLIYNTIYYTARVPTDYRTVPYV